MRIHNFRWIAIISPKVLGSANFLTDQYIPCKMFEVYSSQNTSFELSDNHSLSILTIFYFVWKWAYPVWKAAKPTSPIHTPQSIFCTVVGHLAPPTTTRQKIKMIPNFSVSFLRKLSTPKNLFTSCCTILTARVIDTYSKHTPLYTLYDLFSKSHRECCAASCGNLRKYLGRHIKIEKTNTMTNTWRNTKTKTRVTENK